MPSEDQRREFAKKIGQMNWNDLFKDPKKITIEFLWRIYAESVFSGKVIGRAQYAETKQAFFIGFNECFKITTDMADRLTEDQACEVLSQLHKESADFMNNVIERKFHGAPAEEPKPGEPLKLYAIVGQIEKPDQWNLIGLFDPQMGHMAAINTKRSVIEQMFTLIDEKTKAKAKIITLQEIT